jgi:hypothetical protein
MRVACYAAEIGFRVYFDDVKCLVQDSILWEIQPALDGNDRHTALSQWLDEEYHLLYSSHILAYLLRAIVNTNDGNRKLELTKSHLGSKPLSFFIDTIVKQCSTNPTPRRQPPFITGGHFLAVMRVAIDEMKWCASRDSVEGKDVDLFISEAISHVCQSLKINHIPWSMNQVGGGGTPSSVIIHDVWLNLGATAIPRPPSSASFLTRQESLQIIALNS